MIRSQDGGKYVNPENEGYARCILFLSNKWPYHKNLSTDVSQLTTSSRPVRFLNVWTNRQSQSSTKWWLFTDVVGIIFAETEIRISITWHSRLQLLLSTQWSFLLFSCVMFWCVSLCFAWVCWVLLCFACFACFAFFLVVVTTKTTCVYG